MSEKRNQNVDSIFVCYLTGVWSGVKLTLSTENLTALSWKKCLLMFGRRERRKNEREKMKGIMKETQQWGQIKF